MNIKWVEDIEQKARERRRKQMAKKVRLHGLMLLGLYGVYKKKIDKNPENLETFIRLLTDDILN